MQIKVTMRQHYTPIRMAKILKTKHTKVGGCERTGSLIH